MPLVRRNYHRVNIKKSVTVTVNDREIAYAECKNLSMGGMCISIRGSVKKDQCGLIEFTYECENESINFKGEFTICWMRITDDDAQEFGLKFDYYDSTNLTNLARIVLKQLHYEKMSETG